MTIVRCEECSPAEDKEETRCGVWSPEECEIHQSGRGDLLGWKGMPQEELAVICGRKEKKRFKKAGGTSRLVGPRLGCLYQLASPGFLFWR